MNEDTYFEQFVGDVPEKPAQRRRRFVLGGNMSEAQIRDIVARAVKNLPRQKFLRDADDTH